MTSDQARDAQHAVSYLKSFARRYWALASLAAAQFLVVLDASIVNIAMPSIAMDMEIGHGASFTFGMGLHWRGIAALSKSNRRTDGLPGHRFSNLRDRAACPTSAPYTE